MTDQVSSLCKSLYFEIRRISQIRNYLSLDVAITLMMSFVLSILDYGNALLSSLSSDQPHKLQKVQNHAAKVIFKEKKQNDHVMPLLRSLHWSPVKKKSWSPLVVDEDVKKPYKNARERKNRL